MSRRSPLLSLLLAASLLSGCALFEGAAARDDSPSEGSEIAILVPGAASTAAEKASYDCGSTTVEAEYFNAGGVSLAALTIGGEFVVASNVLAASGAKYAGDRFIWWTKGDAADLYDLTRGEEAAPVSCRARS